MGPGRHGPCGVTPPGRLVQPVSRRRRRTLSVNPPGTAVAAHHPAGVEPDPLRLRPAAAMIPSLPATAGRDAHLDLVDCTVASAGEAHRVHQGLQQPGAKPEPRLPIRLQRPGTPGQHVTDQVADAHPRQEQKPAVVDDPLQVRLALRLAPTDPAIPGRQAPQEYCRQPTTLWRGSSIPMR